MSDYGIIPPSGEYGTEWPANFVLTQGKEGSISSAGWTEGNEGFIQQTFLGASISRFNIQAGFGDTSTSLFMKLVVDEQNESDGLPFGQGDDPYHNGKQDFFKPPVVGTPVYFKFGKNFATVDQAFRKTIDDLTGLKSMPDQITFDEVTIQGPLEEIPDHHFLRRQEGNNYIFVDKSPLYDPSNGYRGKDHFVFGGILQGWSQSKGSEGQTYDVKVVDPREILGNVTILMNNYQGTTFNNKNLINVYGYLEYDVSDELKEELEGTDDLPNGDLISKNLLTKDIDVSGVVTYVGDDTYRFQSSPFTVTALPESLPITGQGLSRRGDQGIPWYRVNQGLTALFNYNGALPEEYRQAGFGGAIDFRGYQYVVDFSGLPLDLIPQMYFLDFDQMTLLELAQELCDVISHDMFVSLLPVIDHPSNQWLWNHNQFHIQNGTYNQIIAGIIRIDAIDRSQQPEYGAVKTYLDGVRANGVEVLSENLGFELSNVTTDKFVVGAQDVAMYYFDGSRDRNNLQLRRLNNGFNNDYELLEEDQWSLEVALKQQIIPFYGFLGEESVTIPRGFGSFQQIMLDTRDLDARGVGSYYIATEMELRHALKSYEDWAKFLTSYNDVYVENTSDFGNALYKYEAADIQWGNIDNLDGDSEGTDAEISRIKEGTYGVSCPRCVFNSDRDYMGPDTYPASPCNPPYGYPLYYKRAEKIGIATGSIISWQRSFLEVLDSLDKYEARLVKRANAAGFEAERDELISQAQAFVIQTSEDMAFLSDDQLQSEEATRAISLANNFDQEVRDITMVKNILNNAGRIQKLLQDTVMDGKKNAQKVYQFVRKTAEENLGRKFLVKIPKACNLAYATGIKTDEANEIQRGPFGFKPQPINSGQDYGSSTAFNIEISGLLQQVQITDVDPAGNSETRETFNHYLDVDADAKYTYGALKTNFNTVSDSWDFNYEPAVEGGYFDFEMFDRPLQFSSGVTLNESRLPPAIRQMLAPRDMTNIIGTNNRVTCYARYNNSQFYDFSEIGKEGVSNQVITADGAIPDPLEELDNTGAEKLSLERIKNLLTGDIEDLQERCTYVKCEVDTKLYMTPKYKSVSTKVFGRNVKQNSMGQELAEHKKLLSNGATVKAAVVRIDPTFGPAASGGWDGTYAPNGDFERKYDEELQSWVIVTDRQDLDEQHVYALVTVPGRVRPTVDMRYLDAFGYNKNGAYIKHVLTQDVVKGAPGFERPAPVTFQADVDAVDTECGMVPRLFNFLQGAERAWKEAQTGYNRAIANYNQNRVLFSSPSPVYPDIIAIPLLSKERCYGPWLSSSAISTDNRIRYSDIGGRVEFVKDENLAPWNFGGYQLMNEAGKLQAQFSNSLQLFSERGDFSIADVPTGVAIGTALLNGGPLVTSIDIQVSNKGYSTNVRMELYSSSFGKLQKQKEDAIARIGRERQKIIDQNNAMVRKGLGKGTSTAAFFEPAKGVFNQIGSIASEVENDPDPDPQDTISFRQSEGRFTGKDVSTGETTTTRQEVADMNIGSQSNNSLTDGQDHVGRRKVKTGRLGEFVSLETPGDQNNVFFSEGRTEEATQQMSDYVDDEGIA